MPMYVYSCDKCGSTEEHMFLVEKRKSEVECVICGAMAGRDYCGEHNKHGTSTGAWTKPLISQALGVAPSQVKEAERRHREVGCPTDFTKGGQAIIRSRDHRNKLLKLNNMRDRDAGYGDFAGKRM